MQTNFVLDKREKLEITESAVFLQEAFLLLKSYILMHGVSHQTAKALVTLCPMEGP